MKYIKSGIIIIVGLLCLGFGGLSFAQCNPACQDPLICCTKGSSSSCTTAANCQGNGGNSGCPSDSKYCASTDSCIPMTANCEGDEPLGPPTPADIQAKIDCEKQEQMVRKNGACVNDIAGDKNAEKKAKTEQCKKSCKGDTKFCDCKCNGGIILNTDFPFIGRCISKGGELGDGSSSISAIAQAFTNIFMTLIITGGFAMVIRGGVQIAMGQNKDGMKKIQNVVIAFAALGSLGIILRLINPNFFK